MGVLVNSMNDSTLTVAHELARLGSVPTEYQFQAELVFLLATVIFTAIWKVQEGKQLLAMWVEPPSKAIWATYAVGLIGYLSLLVTGLGVGLGMIQELLRMFALGAVAVLLAGTSPYALGRPKALLAILALMPLFFLALRSGMKAEIGLVALPILLPVFRRITALRVASVAGFLLFVVLFIFPFSQAWREANWYQRAESQKADVVEVSSRVVEMWEQNGLLETAEVSTARWLSRASTADSGGLVMQLADRDGFIGPVLIEGLVTIFVPRFLWPDKPTYTPGAWFTWYLGYAASPETATTCYSHDVADGTLLDVRGGWGCSGHGAVVRNLFQCMALYADEIKNEHYFLGCPVCDAGPQRDGGGTYHLRSFITDHSCDLRTRDGFFAAPVCFPDLVGE